MMTPHEELMSGDRIPESTNWHVITGAPCSGKTAVIEVLAQQGYRIVPEFARDYIESRLACGETLDAIKADALAFESHILLGKIRLEKQLNADQLYFMDRAVPDSIAYFELEGLDPTHPLLQARVVRYKSVFLFERVILEKDAVRTEDELTAARLEALLEKSYMRLGYDPIRVPVMPVPRRAEFILERVQGGP
jgi:predicted ATPase